MSEENKGIIHITPYIEPGGPKGLWKCQFCEKNLVTQEWVFKGGLIKKCFKIVCTECANNMDYGLPSYSKKFKIKLQKPESFKIKFMNNTF